MDAQQLEHIALGQLTEISEELARQTNVLTRAADYGAIDHIERASWDPAGDPTHDYSHKGTFRAVAVVNETDADVFVGFTPSSGTAQLASMVVPGRCFVVLPYRGTHVSIGGAAAGTARLVIFSRPQPVAFGAIGSALSRGTATNPTIVSQAAGQQFDVSDRTARALGRVSEGIADSVFGAGVVTAPAAGAVIAQILSASLPAGVYRIDTFGGVGGVAVADTGNLKLQRGGVDLLNPMPHDANGGELGFTIPRLTLDGASALQVKAQGAGTAGVEYAAQIIATRVE